MILISGVKTFYVSAVNNIEEVSGHSLCNHLFVNANEELNYFEDEIRALLPNEAGCYSITFVVCVEYEEYWDYEGNKDVEVILDFVYNDVRELSTEETMCLYNSWNEEN